MYILHTRPRCCVVTTQQASREAEGQFEGSGGEEGRPKVGGIQGLIPCNYLKI